MFGHCFRCKIRNSTPTGTIDVTALAAGVFEVTLGNPPPLAAFDIPGPPFFQILTIDSTPGTPLASVSIGDIIDIDGDGVPDNLDNCTLVPNFDQRDTDADGFGNVCDADLSDDCVVNAVDLGLLRSVFFTSDPDADLNSDGIVNATDLGIFRALFFELPGPSGLADCSL